MLTTPANESHAEMLYLESYLLTSAFKFFLECTNAGSDTAGINFSSRCCGLDLSQLTTCALEAPGPARERRKGKTQCAQKHSQEHNQTANCRNPCKRNQSSATKGFQGFSRVSCEDKSFLGGILLPVELINMIMCCFISYIFHGKYKCFLHNKEKTFHLFFFIHDAAENLWKTSLKGAKNAT